MVAVATWQVTRIDAEDQLAGDFWRVGGFDGGDGEVLVASFGFESFPAVEGALHPGEDIGRVDSGGKFGFEVFAVWAHHIDTLFGAGMMPVILGHTLAEFLEKKVSRVVFDSVEVPLILGVKHINFVCDSDELGAEFDYFRV